MADQRIVNLIRAKNLSGTAAEVLAGLTTKNIEKKNNQKQTTVALANRFGSTKVTVWDNGLLAAGLHWVRVALGGTGIDFSNPQAQSMIDQLQTQGVFSAEDAEILKSVGIYYVSAWENAGYNDDITEEMVSEALELVNAQDNIKSLQDQLYQRYISVHNSIGSGQITEWSQVASQFVDG